MHCAKHLCAQLPQLSIPCTAQAPLCSPTKGHSMGVWRALCWTWKDLCLDAENYSSGLWSLLFRTRPMCGCHWPCAALDVAMCDTGGSL